MIDDARAIERLRAALDEVVVDTGDDTGVGTRVAEPPARRRSTAGRALAIAAASVVLVSAGVWAVAQRDDAPSTPAGPIDTVQPTPSPTTNALATSPSVADPSVTETTTPTTDTASASTADSATDTLPPATGENPMPWFELTAADATPGPITLIPCCTSDPPAPGDSHYMAWTATTGAQDGLLQLRTITSAANRDPEGFYEQRLVEGLPEGTGWLLRALGPGGEPLNGGLELFWARANGDVWLFGSNGLEADDLVDYVRQAVPGSDVPVVIADSALTLVSVGVDGGSVSSQTYDVAGEIVTLIVRDDGGGFQNLWLGDEIEPIEVAGHPGYRTILRNGQVEYVWNAGDTAWATLMVGPQLADRADELVATIVDRTT